MRQTPWRSASSCLSDSFTIHASVARWAPTTSMLLVSLISYIDRNTLSLLAPTIMKETHLSVEQYGFIVSAFSFAYMISNPLWGGVIDRIGLRIGVIGFAWLVMWFFLSRRPEVRHWKPAPESKVRPKISFTDSRIWSFILAYGLGATPLGFVMYAAAIYLNQAMGKDQAFLGKVLW